MNPRSPWTRRKMIVGELKGVKFSVRLTELLASWGEEACVLSELDFVTAPSQVRGERVKRAFVSLLGTLKPDQAQDGEAPTRAARRSFGGNNADPRVNLAPGWGTDELPGGENR